MSALVCGRLYTRNNRCPSPHGMHVAGVLESRAASVQAVGEHESQGGSGGVPARDALDVLATHDGNDDDDDDGDDDDGAPEGEQSIQELSRDIIDEIVQKTVEM